MGIKAADGFRQYVDGAEILVRNGGAGVNGSADIYPAGGQGPFGKYAVTTRGTASVPTHRHAVKKARHGGNVSQLCASLDLRVGIDGATASSVAFCAGVSPASYRDFGVTVSLSQQVVAALSLEIAGLTPTAYHSIPTAVNSGSGVITANKLLLGTLPDLVYGTSYTLEMRARIISPTSGEFIVRLNGSEYVYSFNPSRVTPAAGFEQTGGFGMIIAANRSGTIPQTQCPFTDLVIYDDDEITPWPLGPVDVTYLAADDPDLAVGPASDATFETVSAEATYQIADPAGASVGGVVYARVGAVNGNAATRAQIDIVNGAATVSVVDEVIAPGFVQTIRSAPVGPDMIAAGSVFRARTVAP